MNTIDRRKRELLEELKDKKYRDAYVSSAVNVGVAFQIKAIREQRGMNQMELATLANMKQPRIHELEDASNSHSPKLSTLIRLANAFEVGLIVKFVPISELAKYDLSLESESLEVLSYDKDDYFKELPEEPCLTETITQECGLGSGKRSNIIDLFGQTNGVTRSTPKLGDQGKLSSMVSPMETLERRIIP